MHSIKQTGYSSASRTLVTRLRVRTVSHQKSIRDAVTKRTHRCVRLVTSSSIDFPNKTKRSKTGSNISVHAITQTFGNLLWCCVSSKSIILFRYKVLQKRPWRSRSKGLNRSPFREGSGISCRQSHAQRQVPRSKHC